MLNYHCERFRKLTFRALALRQDTNENHTGTKVNEFLVSKETVVLRRWERSKQKFGFIKRVDKG